MGASIIFIKKGLLYVFIVTLTPKVIWLRNSKSPTGVTPEKYPSPNVFIEEALRCVEEGEKEGITLRIMGAIAIYLHSKDYEKIWSSLGRLSGKIFTDIDFMSYGGMQSKILKFFEKRGYSYNKTHVALHGNKRLIFLDGVVPMIDVFFNKLEMCHTIDFRKRLKVDYPTIPLAELLLEKLQIVKINEKDIKDVIVLLRAHNLGENDNDLINIKYIANLLSKDWGFYYTTMMNLHKIKNLLPQYDALSNEDRSDVTNKIDRIIAKVEREPKSIGWKMRARIGAKKKWYRDVEEVIR